MARRDNIPIRATHGKLVVSPSPSDSRSDPAAGTRAADTSVAWSGQAAGCAGDGYSYSLSTTKTQSEEPSGWVPGNATDRFATASSDSDIVA